MKEGLPPIKVAHKDQTSSTFASPSRHLLQGGTSSQTQTLTNFNQTVSNAMAQANIDAHKFNRSKNQLHNRFELLTPQKSQTHANTPFSARSRSLAVDAAGTPVRSPILLQDTGSIKSGVLRGTFQIENNFGSVASYHNLRQRKPKK